MVFFQALEVLLLTTSKKKKLMIKCLLNQQLAKIKSLA